MRRTISVDGKKNREQKTRTMASSAALKELSSVRVFSGFLRRFEHTSAVLGNLPMKFAVYIPDGADSRKFSTLYFLSGLTCTGEIWV